MRKVHAAFVVPKIEEYKCMRYQGHLKIKSWAEEDQPREKFLLKGQSSLSDAELIAILIGSGNREETAVELSRRILQEAQYDLNRLGKMGVEDYMQFHGIGTAKAITIAAALELGRRRKKMDQRKPRAVNTSEMAYEIIAENLLDLDHEEFWIILLNRSNKLIEKRRISTGGVSGTIADAKIIFKAGLEKLASSIILCHNHPSGNLRPSAQDISLTKKLLEGAKNLDMEILDHLIIGNNTYFSFADEALL